MRGNAANHRWFARAPRHRGAGCRARRTPFCEYYSTPVQRQHLGVYRTFSHFACRLAPRISRLNQCESFILFAAVSPTVFSMGPGYDSNFSCVPLSTVVPPGIPGRVGNRLCGPIMACQGSSMQAVKLVKHRQRCDFDRVGAFLPCLRSLPIR